MPSILSIPREMFRKLSGNATLKIQTETHGSETFVCQFNPDEYNISSTGKFSSVERPGEDSPIIQFIGGSCSKLDLKLYFDTSSYYEIKSGLFAKPKKQASSDVSNYTKRLLELVRIEGKLHTPPLVTFSWGGLNFKGYVQNVNVHYTMFEKGGMPVRAEVNFNIISADVREIDRRLKPKESPDRTKCIVMTSATNLWDLAEREYGDAAQWREIAEANQIMNPLNIPVGTQLKVPALHL